MPELGKASYLVTQELSPGAGGYPAALRCRPDDDDLPTLTMKGNRDTLDRTLIGIFCSVRCPGDIILKTYDLARALRSTDVTLIGGFQSSMEKEFLDLVLRGPGSAVVCPARGVGNMRVPTGWKRPLAEGRLLLLSFFEDKIDRPTVAIAAKRNGYVGDLADLVVIAHAERGGKTEKLCNDKLRQGKSVFVLDSSDNAHLVERGAVPVSASDPTPLTLDGARRSG